jgi:hypothetical protein
MQEKSALFIYGKNLLTHKVDVFHAYVAQASVSSLYGNKAYVLR